MRACVCHQCCARKPHAPEAHQRTRQSAYSQGALTHIHTHTPAYTIGTPGSLLISRPVAPTILSTVSFRPSTWGRHEHTIAQEHLSALKHISAQGEHRVSTGWAQVVVFISNPARVCGTREHTRVCMRVCVSVNVCAYLRWASRAFFCRIRTDEPTNLSCPLQAVCKPQL